MPSDRRQLKVTSFCCYLTSTENRWRPDDHTASKMVKALKGDTINKYFQRPYGRFDDRNKGEFASIVPKILCNNLRRKSDRKAAIVPIPNSSVCSVDSSEFKTLLIAKGIADWSDGQFVALPLLVFRRKQEKTRSGSGTRDAALISGEYVVTGTTDLPIILVDDVLTSGGHLIAACRVLEQKVSLPISAITLGISVKEQRDKPIGEQTTYLDIDPIKSF